MHSHIAKSVLNDNVGSSNACYIQNCVITNRVMKRLRCISIFQYLGFIYNEQKTVHDIFVCRDAKG